MLQSSREEKGVASRAKHGVRFGWPGLLLAAAGALTFLGCVTYKPKPIDAAAQAQALEARTLADPGFEAYARECGGLPSAWPPERWDFRLLTEAALYFSPDLAKARAAVGSAEADLFAAGLREDPTLSASLEHRVNNTGGAPASTWGPLLDIPITTGGKRGIRQAEAAARLRGCRWEMDRTAWMVRSSLRSALLEWQGAKAEVEAQAALASARAEVLALVEERLKAGEASAPEAELARAEAEAAELSLAEARGAEAAARAHAAAVLGLPSHSLPDALPPGIDLSLPDTAPDTEARRHALTSRPDLLAALSDYAASDEALRLAVRDQYPDLHLQPGYLWDQGSDAWIIGLSLALPLLNRNRGAIAQAEAARESAGQRVLALQLSILHELEEAQAGHEAALAAWKQAEALEASRQRSLSAAGQALAAGEEDALSLALARAGLEASRVETLRARLSAAQALGRLEDALEKPLSPADPLPPLPGAKGGATSAH